MQKRQPNEYKQQSFIYNRSFLQSKIWAALPAIKGNEGIYSNRYIIGKPNSLMFGQKS